MKKIAELCGVSEATVSKALRDRPDVGPKTRKRILSIADHYHYRPNALVQSIQRKRTMTVGIACNDFQSEFAGRVVGGMINVLHNHGYEAFIVDWRPDVRDGKHVLRSMGERRVDGLLMLPPAPTDLDEYLDEMRAFHAPMVLADQHCLQAECDVVDSDERKGGYEIVKHLIELGHRNIAVICPRHRLRFEGFRDAMLEYGVGLPMEWLSEAAYHDSAYDSAKSILSQPKRPTAILCFNDTVAAAVLAAAYDLGLTVPKDLSVTGFGDLSISSVVRPALTTVRQFPDQIGSKAAEVLLHRIQEKRQNEVLTPHKSKELFLPVEILIRESTAPPSITP